VARAMKSGSVASEARDTYATDESARQVPVAGRISVAQAALGRPCGQAKREHLETDGQHTGHLGLPIKGLSRAGHEHRSRSHFATALILLNRKENPPFREFTRRAA